MRSRSTVPTNEGVDVKKFLQKIGASVVAAFSTPEAVKAEKYLLVVGLTRAAILIPSASFLIVALVKYLGG